MTTPNLSLNFEMDEYVEQLENWGRWARRDGVSSLGFTRQAPFRSLIKEFGGNEVFIDNHDAELVEEVLSAMHRNNPDFLNLLRLKFFYRMSDDKLAKVFGVARPKINQYKFAAFAVFAQLWRDAIH